MTSQALGRKTTRPATPAATPSRSVRYGRRSRPGHRAERAGRHRAEPVAAPGGRGEAARWARCSTPVSNLGWGPLPCPDPSGDDGAMGARQRFRGRIAGVGSTSGVRVVVGLVAREPVRAVRRRDGRAARRPPHPGGAHRAGARPGRHHLRVRRDPGRAASRCPPVGPAGRGGWSSRRRSRCASTSATGCRWVTSCGWCPVGVAQSPAFATLADPVARVAMRGVRTRGMARAGRREFYGATDLRAVTGAGRHAGRHPAR